MSHHDFSVLYAQYPALIEHMPTTFSSHQFILELARLHQDLYVDALYSYRKSLHKNKPAPFQAVHSVLAQHLHSFPELIIHSGKASSTDIFGQPNDCEQWQKR